MLGFRAKKEVQRLKKAFSEASQKICELEKQNNAIRTILENMVEGVISVAADTRILSINPSVEKIFGISQKEAQGRFFLEIIRNNDIAEVINKVLSRSEFISTEITLIWPVNKIFRINASPIFEEQKVNGCLLVIHDITQIRKLEAIRRDFVANVSHELKTPLTSIKGFVETLLAGALADKENSQHFLKIIQEHTGRLNNLVNDLLDLSHLESKEIKLERKKIDLNKITEEVLAAFKAQIKKKSLTVSNDLPKEVLVNADKDKIGQVITNLVDNAIKFNREKGFIKIYSQDLADNIKITIEDSGCGIPPKDICRIFERFYRVDKARSRELGGTGLGLSIVKHIVELHNGNVGVESTEGFGSQFWFILPK